MTSRHPIAPSSSPYRLSDSRAWRAGVDTDNRAASASSLVVAHLEGLYGAFSAGVRDGSEMSGRVGGGVSGVAEDCVPGFRFRLYYIIKI